MHIGLSRAILLSSVLAGCANTNQLIRQGPRGEALDVGGSVYIAISRDGAYGNHVYTGSGLTASQVVLAAFARHARRAEIARLAESFDETLKTAREKAYRYVIFPTILHWEDRATEWSMQPDRAEVKLEVVDLSKNDAVVESAVIVGKSGLATFGGDHPQDLLPQPVGEFVASLYVRGSGPCDLTGTPEWNNADATEKKRLLEACRGR